MKKSIYILAAAALLLFSGTADAQMGKKEYINAGWQFNATVANSFVENASGYGAYIEGGYYLTPMFAVGGFASFHTNNEYVPKQTYTFNEEKKQIVMDLKGFNKQEKVIKSRLLLYTISRLFGTTKGIEKVHIEDIIKLCEKNIGNKYLTPNKNIKVLVKNQKIYFINLM